MWMRMFEKPRRQFVYMNFTEFNGGIFSFCLLSMRHAELNAAAQSAIYSAFKITCRFPLIALAES